MRLRDSGEHGVWGGYLVPLVTVAVLIAAYLIVHVAIPHDPPFDSRTDAYIAAVGPIRAQQIAFELERHGLLDTNGHLYLHEVGEYIYHTYGPAGVGYCTSDFDSACYNGFTMHLDTGALQTALASCAKAGRAAYYGCIHGAGHAAIAINHYDVPKALQLCGELAATDTIAVNACSFGVFMENSIPHVDILRGHNYEWQLRKSDPLFPCDDPRVAQKYQVGCWRMQGVNLTNVMSGPKAVAICNSIADPAVKRSCFEGFADGYGTQPFDAQKVLAACSAADSEHWKDVCISYFVSRVYLNGFPRITAQQLCSSIDAAGKDMCERVIRNSVVLYHPAFGQLLPTGEPSPW